MEMYTIHAADGALLLEIQNSGSQFFSAGEVQFSPTPVNVTVYIAAAIIISTPLIFEKGVCRWNRIPPAGWATSATHSPDRDSVILLTSDPKHLFCINRANENILAGKFKIAGIW